MSAETLSTSLQHFQMQRYVMTPIYRCAHVFHTLRFVSSLTQACSRYHFLWCWLKTRKISPTGAKNHCKPNHFCLKVTARSKKCAISSKQITNSFTNVSTAAYLSPQTEDEKGSVQQLYPYCLMAYWSILKGYFTVVKSIQTKITISVGPSFKAPCTAHAVAACQQLCYHA